MGRQSSIKRLPPEIRELIGQLRAGGRTIEEIRAKLQELLGDAAPSQSAVGRWTKQLDKISEEINRNRHIAEALVERFGERADNRAARMNIELMHAMITKLMFNEEGTGVELTPQDAYFLGTSLQRLAAAQKLDQERTLKLQQEAAKKAVEKAADRAVESATEAGLSADMAASLRRDVLGVRL